MIKRNRENQSGQQVESKHAGEIVKHSDELSMRIAAIWTAAQAHAARTVSTSHVCAFWFVGREIVEDEQQGSERAAYGKQVLAGASERLAQTHGKTWSVRNLEYARSFFLGYPDLIDSEKANAVRSISEHTGTSRGCYGLL